MEPAKNEKDDTPAPKATITRADWERLNRMPKELTPEQEKDLQQMYLGPRPSMLTEIVRSGLEWERENQAIEAEVAEMRRDVARRAKEEEDMRRGWKSSQKERKLREPPKLPEDEPPRTLSGIVVVMREEEEAEAARFTVEMKDGHRTFTLPRAYTHPEEWAKRQQMESTGLGFPMTFGGRAFPPSTYSFAEEHSPRQDEAEAKRVDGETPAVTAAVVTPDAEAVIKQLNKMYQGPTMDIPVEIAEALKVAGDKEIMDFMVDMVLAHLLKTVTLDDIYSRLKGSFKKRVVDLAGDERGATDHIQFLSRDDFVAGMQQAATDDKEIAAAFEDTGRRVGLEALFREILASDAYQGREDQEIPDLEEIDYDDMPPLEDIPAAEPPELKSPEKQRDFKWKRLNEELSSESARMHPGTICRWPVEGGMSHMFPLSIQDTLIPDVVWATVNEDDDDKIPELVRSSDDDDDDDGGRLLVQYPNYSQFRQPFVKVDVDTLRQPGITVLDDCESEAIALRMYELGLTWRWAEDIKSMTVVPEVYDPETSEWTTFEVARKPAHYWPNGGWAIAAAKKPQEEEEEEEEEDGIDHSE
jgi:hypothetical protein